jgi:hypothetical protein
VPACAGIHMVIYDEKYLEKLENEQFLHFFHAQARLMYKHDENCKKLPLPAFKNDF